MKKFLLSIAVLTVLAGPVCAELPAPKIAVVDQIRILRNSKAVKGIEEQFAGRREAFQTEVSAQEKSLKSDEADLKKKSASLTPEAFRKEREVFEQKVAAAQKKVQELKTSIDADYNKALKVVQDNMLQIMENLAKEHDINLVLPSHQILLFAPELDLTDDVVAKLNVKLPSVKVEETGKAEKNKK